MNADVLSMALSGFTVSVLVPGLIRATRDRRTWERMTLPAGVVLPLFVVLHAAAVLAPAVFPLEPGSRVLLEAALVAGSFLFWLPVVGPGRRLSDPGRCVYLFLAGPALELPAVFLIALGHTMGGLAMIGAMLPVGGAAMAVTWRWIIAEERAAQAVPAPERTGRPA